MDTQFSGRLLAGSCVHPEGRFVHAIHRPWVEAANFRTDDWIVPLGWTEDGQPRMNTANFPPGDVQAARADTIFEIPNPFPFRGVTYICRSWADQKADNPAGILIPPPRSTSLHRSLESICRGRNEEILNVAHLLQNLPETLQLALAATSSDPLDLKLLAELSGRFHYDQADGQPTGLVFDQDPQGPQGRSRPCILNRQLFEIVVNNPHLPDAYKEAMVLRPGVQGASEIVGEWRVRNTHVYEYLRRNSYIPWGHYAANMAHDAVRYAMGDMTLEDISGMRHLYYQRTYARLAEHFCPDSVPRRRPLSGKALETMRRSLLKKINSGKAGDALPFSATLWGWNYGFGYASSGYRLHASHQQIHQQFALIPARVPIAGGTDTGTQAPYACGDLIADFVKAFRLGTGADFFACYQKALTTNQRLDGRPDLPADLVVYSDEHVLLFVPKAQTSQWELQLMPTTAVGNILEADSTMRRSLDQALFIAMQVLTGMGASMISVIEYSKRFDDHSTDQRLLYAFLPKMPESPGAFSEAQLRWINGHYPEDFAQACRLKYSG